MMTNVGGPDVVVRINSQSMGHTDQAISPGTDELTAGTETTNWLVAAVKQVKVPLAVDGDSRARAQFQGVGDLEEIGNRLITGRLG